MALNGIRIFSKNQTLQIDENYNNLYMVNKAIFSMSATGNQPTTYLSGAITYTAATRNNLVSFTCLTVGVQILIFKGNGNEYYFTADAPCTLVIYEFGKLANAPSYGRFGIKVVRKSDNTVSFDSTRKPMRVIEALTYDIAVNGTSAPSTQNFDFTVPSGKTYAFCASQITSNYIGLSGPIAGGGQRIYYYRCGTPGCKLINSNTFRASGGLAYGIGGGTNAGTYDYGKGTVNGFVIDVTYY
ncbi:hypothetical protein [Acinetobacter bereziniae]|uniref:hypothetical protein n=1 Tax=Acinetobacter bereziniae TaxID=106648 RepID=UPI0032B569BB